MSKLKTLRESHGLTQKEVAQYLGIATVTYGKYERGVRFIPEHRVVFLAKLYNLRIDSMLAVPGKTELYNK